ncbi:hypothetical protein D3C81_1959960 [compost metagenome]
MFAPWLMNTRLGEWISSFSANQPDTESPMPVTLSFSDWAMLWMPLISPEIIMLPNSENLPGNSTPR